MTKYGKLAEEIEGLLEEQLPDEELPVPEGSGDQDESEDESDESDDP